MNVWETKIGYDLVSEIQDFLRRIQRNCFANKTHTFSVQCGEDADEICKVINEETKKWCKINSNNQSRRKAYFGF